MKNISDVIKINKQTGRIEMPSLLLTNRSGKAFGDIHHFTNFHLSLVGNGLDEISFDVPKYTDGIPCPVWDDLTDLKIVEVRHFGRFEISVNYSDSAHTTKSVHGVSLETELGQIYLHDFHVNDEEAADMRITEYSKGNYNTAGDFLPTVFYNESDEEHSLLHRVLADRAPHWKLGFITPYIIPDENSKPELSSAFQRTYTVDGESVYDFLTGTVAKECNVVFEFNTLARTVNCYNLCDYTVKNTTEHTGSIPLTALELSKRIKCGHKFEITELSNEKGHVICRLYDENDKYLRDIPYIISPDANLSDFPNLPYRKTPAVLDVSDAHYIRFLYANNKETINTVSYKTTYLEGSSLGFRIGEDTNIFISKQNLANEITISSNKDHVKNCFRIEGGDDTITDMVRAASMNGSNYIYQFADFQYRDMSNELQDKIKDYQKMMASQDVQDRYYGDNAMASFLSGSLTLYVNSDLDAATLLCICRENQIDTGNADILSHQETPYWYVKNTDGAKQLCLSENVKIPNGNVEPAFQTMGIYKRLCTSYDLLEYFESSLMPKTSPAKEPGTAKAQYDKVVHALTAANFHIAVSSKGSYNNQFFVGITNNILSYAPVLLDDGFDFSVVDETAAYDADSGKWQGKIQIVQHDKAQNIYPADPSTVSPIQVKVSDDPLKLAEQKIEKELSKGSMLDVNLNIDTILNDKELDDSEKTEKIKNIFKLYSANRLKSFRDGYNSCLSILMELGLATTGLDTKQPVKVEIYDRYVVKSEIAKKVYEDRISLVNDIQSQINSIQKEQKIFIYGDETHTPHDFRTYIGQDLYLEFSKYRREDTYTNSNYISDGLSTSACIAKARELIDAASKEARKACVLQRTISTSLNNLFALPEFEPLYDKFALFNYIRVRTEDEILKLRLIGIDFNGDSAADIQVTFSDQIESVDGSMSDLQSIIAQASSISTSYPSTALQAKQGAQARNTVREMYTHGLNAAKTMLANNDSNEITITPSGILCKRMDDEGFYGEKQFRITGNIMAFTDDNWKSVKMAIGETSFKDPSAGDTDKMKQAYGIIAENIVGKMMVSENMYIGNENGTVQITGDGIDITNGSICLSNESYSIDIDPNHKINDSLSDYLFCIRNKIDNNIIIGVDTNGNGHFSGHVTTSYGKIANFNITKNNLYTDEYTSAFATNKGIYFGKEGLVIGNKFKVDSNGSGYFNGDIYAKTLHLTEDIVIGSSNIPELSAEVTRAEKEENDLSQRISNTINGLSLSVENGDKSANLKLSYTKEGSSEILMDAKEINFSGLVSFSDLKNSGTTEINGSNITTGSINANLITTGTLSADRIEVTDKLVMKYGALNIDVARFEQGDAADGAPWNLAIGKTDVSETGFFNILFKDYTRFKKAAQFDYAINCAKSICAKEYMLDLSNNDCNIIEWASSKRRICMGNNAQDLYIRGKNITSESAITIDSDERLKNSFMPLDKFEKAYMDLKPYAFKYNNGTSNRFHFGFKAQNVRDSLLNNGFTTKDFAGFVQMADNPKEEGYGGIDDPMGLRYTEFISWNTHMIQKLYKENQSLNKKIEHLEKIIKGEQ